MSWLRRFRPKPKPTPRRTVWRAERADGKCWAGEYLWQGRTFTHDERFIYLWGSEAACRAAIQWRGFANVRPVEVEFDSSVKRPKKKRYNHNRWR
jgi:hypothetical protein